ncbi:Na/Pi cotransporter family protein [Paraclostridium sordellii]|uniref:Sodium:phosphate symporter n=1 Tax=Paraclostridium sordellii TaxID=1505 RepID=A0A0C7E7W2_PARSO|nr:Na/Pi cotransporter family protein [Paeniclostridium sordellii]QYE97113.1 Na/Pi cotransporter family protein [Paeniclostridium sordellii]CEN21306.1 sodium:phosphate symporter [[Clostridium] sordellii] [Paeniclostridium sordellii]CEN79121.1 sodium:phosphate symporter [[Clostridium] sordellii] [Paeniclostridium sordellii]CEP88483.1 sodium:phosphate symporter [[Clostridium] sordellii] [Paeniclostridium sordellii]CEP96957.1 sodium:phosphate symporter [[Clostridium] sordellii] [Paeniclostridium 
MSIFISLIGGLGLFLYGMNLMGEGLQKSTGPKLEKAIELLTSNVVMGVLVGAVVTGIIQSSGATTVMVVGFVNAGIMTLYQAIGVIMGANIGTTVTAQLVSFDASIFSSIALGIGIILYMIGCKSKPNLKNISEILIGFGILFIGMEFMKDAVAPLSQYEGFRSLLANLANHPLLALLAGFAMTTCLQSSSASMGILIALSSQGLMPLAGALPILYGDNIGSCTTSLLSSVGANKNAKRAALMHLCFNVIGTMLFMIVLNKPISMIVTYLDPTDTARQIANSHTLFNIINVIMLIPFSKYIVKLVMLLIPDKKDEDDEYDSRITKYLDERMLETPSIAFGNTIRETLRMGNKAKKSFTCSMNALLEKSEDDAKTTFEKEKILNEQQRKVLDYLIKLSNRTLDDKMRFSLDLLFHTVNDIERVGDLSENIAELAEVAIQNKTKISDSAKSELIDIYSKVLDAYELSLDAMKQNNSNLANDVLKIEDEVDALDKLYRAKHMNRLNSHSCSIDSGIMYLDLLTNLERISDHSASIAKRVIKINQTS